MVRISICWPEGSAWVWFEYRVGGKGDPSSFGQEDNGVSQDVSCVPEDVL